MERHTTKLQNSLNTTTAKSVMYGLLASSYLFSCADFLHSMLLVTQRLDKRSFQENLDSSNQSGRKLAVRQKI